MRSAGWSDGQWARFFSVVAEQGDLPLNVGLPPMLGRCRIEGASVWFEPRYPLQPGVRYRAEVRWRHWPGRDRRRDADPVLSASFRPPVPVLVPSTVVNMVYPSAAVVPENLLKFYLEFSAPMSRGHIYDHIHLLDEAGREVELPFLEIDEELWDPSMTRLTLFIDPGRIKRGVTPLEEVGPALQADRRYALVIDANWRDAAGASLRSEYRKTFRVGPPDRTEVDPGRWRIRPPAAGTREPLVVQFDRPLDWALARRMIQVRHASGTAAASGPMGGSVTLGAEEREWRFAPDKPWARGTMEIVVPDTIEDLAGNNIGKAFEVDLFERVQRRVTNTVSRLTFATK